MELIGTLRDSRRISGWDWGLRDFLMWFLLNWWIPLLSKFWSIYWEILEWMILKANLWSFEGWPFMVRKSILNWSRMLIWETRVSGTGVWMSRLERGVCFRGRIWFEWLLVMVIFWTKLRSLCWFVLDWWKWSRMVRVSMIRVRCRFLTLVLVILGFG